MNFALWLAIAIPTLIVAAPITQGGLRRIEHKQLDKFVGSVGLPLPDYLVQPLLHRISAHERWAMIGGAAGFALAAIIVVPLGWLDNGGALLLVAAALGVSFGGALAILTGRHRFSLEAPRMARAQRTTLADYAPTWQRRGQRLVPVVAVAAFVSAIGLLQLIPWRSSLTGTWLLAAAGLTVATVLAWLIAELLSAAVISRPQHARSQLELAWDDVLRAEALRGLSMPVMIVGAISVFAAAVVVAGTLADPDGAGVVQVALLVGVLTVVAMLLWLAALTALGYAAFRTGASAWVVRRLWAMETFDTEVGKPSC